MERSFSGHVFLRFRIFLKILDILGYFTSIDFSMHLISILSLMCVPKTPNFCCILKIAMFLHILILFYCCINIIICLLRLTFFCWITLCGEAFHSICLLVIVLFTSNFFDFSSGILSQAKWWCGCMTLRNLIRTLCNDSSQCTQRACKKPACTSSS